MRTELGKITHVSCGFGGYDDAQIGIGFVLEGEDFNISTPFYGAWGHGPGTSANWTEEDRIKSLGETFIKIRDWLRAAKVKDISSLKGIPVECIFDGNRLKEWRILTEVL